jgi:hypothetical protein
MLYVAGKDIELRSTLIKAGLPLPDRFQNRYAAKLLKRDLGEDAIKELKANDQTLKVVDAGAFDALVAENKQLHREIEKLKKREGANAA